MDGATSGSPKAGLPAYLRSFPAWSLLFVAALLVLTAWFALVGPRVPVAGGLGWDGKIYGACALDLGGCLASGKYSAYSLGRLFPSAMIHGALLVTGSPATAGAAVLAFALWNLACTWAGMALWFDISRRSGLRPRTAVFGLAALFMNFAMVRMAFYAPVSTDYTAYFLAIATLWAYVARRPLANLAIFIPAALTWPASVVASATVVVARGREGGWQGRRPTTLAGVAMPLLIVIAYAAVLVYFLRVRPDVMQSGAVQIDANWLPVAALASMAYVFWASRSALAAEPWRALSVSWRLLAATAATWAVYAAISRWLGGFAGPPDAMDAGRLFRALATSGLIYPGASFVAHGLYFGAWALAFVLLLPRLFHALAGAAPAILPLLALGSVFFLLAESRGLVFLAPFLVFALAIAIDRGLSERTCRWYLLASLPLSHFWLPLPTVEFGPLLDFPAQSMFLHIGPWMGPVGYFIGLAHAVVAACLAALLYRDLRPDGAGPGSPTQ